MRFKLVTWAVVGVGTVACSAAGPEGFDEKVGEVSEALCTAVKLTPSAASASSSENTSFPASNAIDGNTATRWSSAFSDPQWIRVDLGARRFISRVVLRWEAAASKNYDLQVSDDGVTFTTIYNTASGDGGVDDITGLSAQGRYLRMYSRSRTTQWGNSLWEVETYGDANPSCGGTQAFAPRTILGQPAFTETALNQVVNNRVFHPQGVMVQKNDTSTADRVYVVDSGNQRILGFNSLGTCSGGTAPGRACTNDPECPGTGASCSISGTRAADIVIGQKDFTSATCNGDNTQSLPASASTLCLQPYPRTISVMESPEASSLALDSAGALYVPDKWNHRVLKYNDPFGTDRAADFVWGQPDFAARACNQGQSSPSASSLCLNLETTGVHVTGDETGTGVDVSPDGKVWVTDVGNNRVLRFPANSKTADLVLGQPSFTSGARDGTECARGGGGVGQHLCYPKVVRYHAATNKLFVVDWKGFPYVDMPYGEYRVLVYNKPAAGDFTSGMAASEIITGNNDGVTNGATQQWRRPTGLDFPVAASTDFWLNDTDYDRLLFYTKASGTWKATKVLSQANLTDTGGIGVNCANGAQENDHCLVEHPAGSLGVDSAGNIYVGEGGTPRVLRFTGNPPNAPVTGGAATAASAILFPRKTDHFGLANANLISGKSMLAGNYARLVKYANGTMQLVALDQYRAIFWNDYANKASGASADGGLYYQPDLSSNTSNGNAPNVLYGIDIDASGRVFIGVGNHVDVFQGPLTQGQAPLKSISMDLPLRFGNRTGQVQVAGLAMDTTNNALFVSDTFGHRVLRINDPLGSSPSVNLVIGQKDAFSLEANRSRDITNNFNCPTIQPDGFGNLGQLRLDKNGNLFVVDSSHEGWQCSNNRILEFEKATLVPSASKDFFCGAIDSGCTDPRKALRVYGPPNLSTRGAGEGGPTDIPNIPFSISFDVQNRMILTGDGYGNPQGKRAFFYRNPVPSCTIAAGCAVAPTSIFPLTAAQPADSSFDPDGNLIVLDHTWNRVLFHAAVDVSAWIAAQP
jgi:hypothetical protein